MGLWDDWDLLLLTQLNSTLFIYNRHRIAIITFCSPLTISASAYLSNQC